MDRTTVLILFQQATALAIFRSEMPAAKSSTDKASGWTFLTEEREGVGGFFGGMLSIRTKEKGPVSQKSQQSTGELQQKNTTLTSSASAFRFFSSNVLGCFGAIDRIKLVGHSGYTSPIQELLLYTSKIESTSWLYGSASPLSNKAEIFSSCDLLQRTPFFLLSMVQSRMVTILANPLAIVLVCHFILFLDRNKFHLDIRHWIALSRNINEAKRFSTVKTVVKISMFSQVNLPVNLLVKLTGRFNRLYAMADFGSL